MKKVFFSFFTLALAFAALGQDLAMNTTKVVENTDAAIFKWDATEYDFGTVKAGTPVSHEFTFTNTGTIPLVITSVKASCGCTVTAYSKDPISPNGDGFVKATYDAAKPEKFSKTVTVTGNTDSGPILLTIKGEVVE